MNQQENKIKCPDCGREINVNDILYHQVSEQVNDDLVAERSRLAEEKKGFKKEQEQQQEEVARQIKNGLKQKEQSLKEKYKKEAEEEQSDAINSMREELEEKSNKVKELHKLEIELEKTKREKGELTDSIKAEAEKELNQKLQTEKEKIQEKNALKIEELKKQLEDQKKLTEEMKRKQEQGSMQTQGEVQELAIEDWLSSTFPLDTIQEIKKGEQGADCLQIVNTHSQQNCGTIYYESKRTKAFSQNWIEKFKSDIKEKNADIGVLVTETMPKDMERLGQKDGIWVCSFSEFKGLCSVLRESVIKLSNAIGTQENKGDKMNMLYDFLTSNEFRLQIEAIVEGFSQMHTDLQKEKNAMSRIWKQREKQINKVLVNTVEMHGSIKGIAGNAIQNVQALELLPDDEDA